MLLHSPKAHSRAGHPCVDDRRQNRAGPASLAARVDDMRKNGNAEKRPTLFQCRRSTLGTRDGGDAHARIWRAVARAARRVARNSGGRPSGRDRQINRSYQSQHAPAADALHCVRLQSRRAHGNTSALARTAGRSCSNYAQCVWACACRGWPSGNIEADDVGWSDIDEARAGMSSLA